MPTAAACWPRCCSFNKFKKSQSAQPGGTEIAAKEEPATQSPEGGRDVHLMGEDEYLQYFKR